MEISLLPIAVILTILLAGCQKPVATGSLRGDPSKLAKGNTREKEATYKQRQPTKTANSKLLGLTGNIIMMY